MRQSVVVVIVCSEWILRGGLSLEKVGGAAVFCTVLQEYGGWVEALQHYGYDN